MSREIIAVVGLSAIAVEAISMTDGEPGEFVGNLIASLII